MNEKTSTKEFVIACEKEGEIIFATIEGLMGAKIAEFIRQPVDGILYDLNRDKVTLLSQFSEDNIRWVNDYAVAVTITALRSELERVREENRWIPVSERFPERYDEFYLISENGDDALQAFFFKDNGWIHEGERCHPTHWRPLPQPPEVTNE
jgi:hypothetical protein